MYLFFCDSIAFESHLKRNRHWKLCLLWLHHRALSMLFWLTFTQNVKAGNLINTTALESYPLRFAWCLFMLLKNCMHNNQFDLRTENTSIISHQKKKQRLTTDCVQPERFHRIRLDNATYVSCKELGNGFSLINAHYGELCGGKVMCKKTRGGNSSKSLKQRISPV